MRITLKPDQEMVIQAAIQSGLIRSVDEFIAVFGLWKCGKLKG